MSDKVQSKSLKLAVLIDAENAAAEMIEPLLKEIAKYGTALIRRVYGDWAKPQLSGWKTKAIDLAIRPMQQCSYATGKNSADIALIIDAMDLLHTQDLDGFCIVSSDSDYTSLAIRIREQGLQVFGFGEAKTRQAFVGACDRFIFTESLKPANNVVAFQAKAQSKTEVVNQDSEGKTTHQTSKSFSGLIKIIESAYQTAQKNGATNLSALGQALKKQSPAFEAKQYGHSTLTSLVRAIDIFDIEENPKGTQLKLKKGKKKA